MTIESILLELLEEVKYIRSELAIMNNDNNIHFEEWRKKNIEEN